MKAFRATVDYGDDRIRTYLVQAETIDEASKIATDYALSMVSVDTIAEAEEWDEDDFDGEL